jgi:hypothetical protein
MTVEYGLRGNDTAHTALHAYKWDDLVPCFKAPNRVVKVSESSTALLCRSWEEIGRTRAELLGLDSKGNLYAKSLAGFLIKRRVDIASEGVMLSSHLMTRAGWLWLRSLPDDDPARLAAAPGGPAPLPEGRPDHDGYTKAKVRKEIETELTFWIKELGADARVMYRTLTAHLTMSPDKLRLPRSPLNIHQPPDTRSEDQLFWDAVKAGWLEGNRLEGYDTFIPLATMAEVLINPRPSEADVDRVFSHMGELFGDHAQSMADELIEARLLCTLEQARSFSEMIDRLDSFCDYRDEANRILLDWTGASPEAFAPNPGPRWAVPAW